MEQLGPELKRFLQACSGDPDRLAALEAYVSLLAARDATVDHDGGPNVIALATRESNPAVAGTNMPQIATAYCLSGSFGSGYANRRGLIQNLRRKVDDISAHYRAALPYSDADVLRRFRRDSRCRHAAL
jgi:hypothetical protein